MNEWTTVDKTTWGPGPWQNEPDKVHWIDPETDLDCLMNRGPSGYWCGYVAVAEGHPFFDKGYGECTQDCGEHAYCEHSPEAAISVHGGLTFAAFCAEGDDPSTGICHVPLLGRPDHVWWLGFDFAHAGDLSPAMASRDRARGWAPIGNESYRDRAYVEAEVLSVARQLREVGETGRTAP